ncbi:MAG: methyltransferase domain-containing protein [Candidatus Heimdallarchaeota archaeon]|nr:MAG: methyltransferase domain-containing protein [Candidatus Heimdallarchaeota archaeon]
MEDLPSGLLNSGAKEILKGLEVISGGKVLDVATEKGGFINTLMKVLKDYDSFIGIDIFFKDLDSIKREFEDKPVEFIEMNAENLKFFKNSFDTVTISHSLHHLTSVKKVLTEMVRVLKPDGYFILQEPFHDGIQSEAQLTDIDQHHWGSKIDNLLNIPHNFTFTKHKLKETVKELGLRELNIIEATHFVKCLFCDDKFDCEDPKNEGIIKFALNEIDRDLKRLSKLGERPEYNKLKEEGERLKERVRRTGSAPSSHMLFIGKK